MLTTQTISVDEETWYLAEQPSALWLIQGRFGIWLFNQVFTVNGSFVPFIGDLASVLLWLLTAVIWLESITVLFTPRTKRSFNFPLYIALTYMCTVPYVTGEILYFSCMNTAVALGMVCTSLAASIVTRKEIHFKQLALSVVLLSIGLSMYQAIVTVYVTAVVGYVFCVYLQQQRILWKQIGKSIVVCLLSLLVYFAIFRLSNPGQAGSSYFTENYIGWNGSSWLLSLLMALANPVRVLLGLSTDQLASIASFLLPSVSNSVSFPEENIAVFGGAWIATVTVLSFIWLVYRIVRTKRQSLLTLLFFVFLILSPFCIYIALGTARTQGRMVLALPFAQGLMLYLLLQENMKQVLHKVLVCACSIIISFNVINMNRIYSYAYVSYKTNVRIANELMDDIRRTQADYHDMPIAWIGCPQIDPLPVEKSGTLGASLLTWDGGNSVRINNFLRCEGYAVFTPDRRTLQRATGFAESMPIWPSEGSIAVMDDCIVVHLSEVSDEWLRINLP